MRRLTTPTHTFTLPFPVAECKSVLITYAQGQCIKFEKTLDDATFEGNVITVRLSQEETSLLTAHQSVSIQVRVLTSGDDALASSIMHLSVDDVLNSEVLT